MKKAIKNNLIKLTIGLLLLLFCFLYIQKYPAEKIAIFSGFDVMIQKAKIIFGNVFTHNSDDIKDKFDYEKAYEELIRIAESNGCEDPSILQELEEVLNSLQNEPIKTLSDVMPGYIRKANELKNKVRDYCKK